jgi:hypothetical protein
MGLDPITLTALGSVLAGTAGDIYGANQAANANQQNFDAARERNQLIQQYINQQMQPAASPYSNALMNFMNNTKTPLPKTEVAAPWSGTMPVNIAPSEVAAPWRGTMPVNIAPPTASDVTLASRTATAYGDQGTTPQYTDPPNGHYAATPGGYTWIPGSDGRGPPPTETNPDGTPRTVVPRPPTYGALPVPADPNISVANGGMYQPQSMIAQLYQAAMGQQPVNVQGAQIGVAPQASNMQIQGAQAGAPASIDIASLLSQLQSFAPSTVVGAQQIGGAQTQAMQAGLPAALQAMLLGTPQSISAQQLGTPQAGAAQVQLPQLMQSLAQYMPQQVQAGQMNTPLAQAAQVGGAPQINATQAAGPQAFNIPQFGGTQVGGAPQVGGAQVSGPQAFNAPQFGGVQVGNAPQIGATQAAGPQSFNFGTVTGTQGVNAGQDALMQAARRDNSYVKDPSLQFESGGQYNNSGLFDALNQQGLRGLDKQVAQLQGSAGSLGQRFGTAMNQNEANLRGDFLTNLQAQNQQIGAQSFEQAAQRGLAAQGMGLQREQGQNQANLAGGAQNLAAGQALSNNYFQGQGIDQAASLANAQNQLQAALANQQTGMQGAQLNTSNQLAVGQQNLQAQLQAALANAGYGQQAGLANQSAGLQIGQANQQSELQAQLANQSAGLQVGQTNASNMLAAGSQNLQAQLQTILANAGYSQQAGLANQASTNQAALANQQAALQAALANSQMGNMNQSALIQAALQAAQTNYGGALQTSLANQQSANTGQLANQQIGAQTSQANLQALLQSLLANQSSANTGALANQQVGAQYGLANQAAQNTAGQFNAGMQTNAQASNIAQQQQYNNFIASLLGQGAGMQATQTAGNTGLIGLLAGLAVPQAQPNTYGQAVSGAADLGMLPWLLQQTR